PAAPLLGQALPLPGDLSAPQARVPGATAPSPLEAIDALHDAGPPRRAFEAALALAAAHPDDPAAQWRAARAAVVMGLLEPTSVEQNPWYDEAIVLGERAVALAPDDLDALYWLAAAK